MWTRGHSAEQFHLSFQAGHGFPLQQPSKWPADIDQFHVTARYTIPTSQVKTLKVASGLFMRLQRAVGNRSFKACTVSLLSSRTSVIGQGFNLTCGYSSESAERQSNRKSLDSLKRYFPDGWHTSLVPLITSVPKEFSFAIKMRWTFSLKSAIEKDTSK